MSKPIYVIDGSSFSTLEGFFLKIRDLIAPSAGDGWIHSLDALNDELYRGDERPEGGFVLVWRNSVVSRDRLSYLETVRQLEKNLEVCHPSNRKHIKAKIERAKQEEGTTVFDRIIDVIRVHEEVELRLE
jgi:hypothetical protein